MTARARKRRITNLFTAAALLIALLGVAPAAHAFGFRLGGKFQVGAGAPLQLFAFGMVHDFTLISDVLYMPMDTTIALNGEYLFIEGGIIGLRVAIPLANNRVRPGFHAKFTLKDAIRFKPDSANGFGLGGRFGGGVAFRFQEAGGGGGAGGGEKAGGGGGGGSRAELFIDVEVDVYQFVQHSASLGLDGDQRQHQLNLMIGMRF